MIYTYECQETEYEKAKRKLGFVTNVTRNVRRRVWASHLAGLLTQSPIWFEDNATDNCGHDVEGAVAMYTTKRDLSRFWRIQRILCKLFCARP